jgi:predicted negative regulator of RcsB-dependent stress response
MDMGAATVLVAVVACIQALGIAYFTSKQHSNHEEAVGVAAVAVKTADKATVTADQTVAAVADLQAGQNHMATLVNGRFDAAIAEINRLRGALGTTTAADQQHEALIPPRIDPALVHPPAEPAEPVTPQLPEEGKGSTP